MIQEFEKVVFTVDLPEYHLVAGDVGTAVDIFTTAKSALSRCSTLMATPSLSWESKQARCVPSQHLIWCTYAHSPSCPSSHRAALRQPQPDFAESSAQRRLTVIICGAS